MVDLLTTTLIMSLVCCGAHVVINDDWIGHSSTSQNYLPKSSIYKPLFTCARCMASLWGGATYILLHGLDINIIPAIIAAAFLNSVFINYYYSKS
jgi:hypothetical protein